MLVRIALLIASVHAQNKGTQTEEFHPPLPIQHCTKANGCTTEKTMLTMDSNWRWTHHVGTTKNCYTGNVWDKTYCPDIASCTKNCAIDGVDNATWASTYGVTYDEKGAVNMSFVTNGTYSRNVGSRTYLMEDDTNYKIWNLVGKEFTFDVDVSVMPCGLNGAVYFVEMDKDGGMAKYPDNKAGAALGTGYCDAQCPHDLKWINGQANIGNWTPSKTDINAGTGHYGTCCAELDIWEANKISTQMTVHSCKSKGQYRCEGVDCGDNQKGDRFKGVCDKDGGDFNPYRVGDKMLYGPGSEFKLDTTKKMTVVTQFISSDGTETGDLKEMRRFYMQDGKVVPNSKVSYGDDPTVFDSITDAQQDAQKKYYADVTYYQKLGGIKSMGDAMKRGMVLVLSMWDDHDVGMIWLDATDPYPIPTGKNGAPRGTCNQTEGLWKAVEENHPHSWVKYSNVKYGEIGSTYPSAPSSCPGGSAKACMNQCPDSTYKSCAQGCLDNCPNMVENPDNMV